MARARWPLLLLLFLLLLLLLLLPSVEPRRSQKRKLLSKRHSAALEQGTALSNQQRWSEAAHAYQVRGSAAAPAAVSLSPSLSLAHSARLSLSHTLTHSLTHSASLPLSRGLPLAAPCATLRGLGCLARNQEAIEADPSAARGHYNLGVCLAAMGRPEEAAAAYDTATQRDSAHANAFYNGACV
jgi:tetratricopeptide (TPR) repeat protein